MAVIHTLILRTAGTNCDIETAFAFQQSGAQVEILHVNRVTEAPNKLKNFQILVLPGGFSYGDDVAAGSIFSNELKNKLGEPIADFVADGKLVLGICNGFQVMVKMGLLPGSLAPNRDQQVTLSNNDSNKFEDRWVYLKAESKKCVFTQGIETQYIPVAHGEGKFIAQDKELLDSIEANDQVAFRYIGENSEQAKYPWNPNGSQRDIAGICDSTGRILGLMPHPERHFLPTHHPRWTREGLQEEGEGAIIFRNAVQYFK